MVVAFALLVFAAGVSTTTTSVSSIVITVFEMAPFAIIAVALPPVPIYLDFRKIFYYGMGSVGYACIISKSSYKLSMLKDLLAFGMKNLQSHHPHLQVYPKF